MLGHQARLEEVEAVEEAEDLRPGSWPDPLAGLLVDGYRPAERRLVGKEIGAYVRDRQVTAARDAVAQAGHDPGGVFVVGYEVQDREQQDRHWPAEVQVRLRQQVGRTAQVSVHHDAPVGGREQGLPVADHDRVVIHVQDASLGVDLQCDLVHRTLGGQPDADVEELVDTGLAG